MENSTQENPRSKQPRKKIFHSLRTHLAIFGISPSLSAQQYRVNWRISLVYGIFALSTNHDVKYLLYEAKTFTEYTKVGYAIVVFSVIVAIYSIFILNVEKLFKFIDDGENIVNTSEYKIQLYHSLFSDILWLILILFENSIDSTEIFIIWIHIQWGHSIRTEIESSSILCHVKDNTILFVWAMDNSHLLNLFYYRFGRRCIRTAISIVVCMSSHQLNRKHYASADIYYNTKDAIWLEKSGWILNSNCIESCNNYMHCNGWCLFNVFWIWIIFIFSLNGQMH